jgi:hypothetical protein
MFMIIVTKALNLLLFEKEYEVMLIDNICTV